MNIGEFLKAYRKKHGYSRKELASKLKIPYSTYSNYENNNRTPNFDVIHNMAHILQVPLNDVLGDMYEVRSGNAYSLKKDGTLEPHSGEYIDLSKKGVLIDHFEQLNTTGQDEAVKRVEELTHIEKYTKED